ncbi:M23 family metallopeptidase [Agromyces fucosus]|uniref:M23 family metallopeptidase n=1 Tax=Agromyces fucosus TaxID=41985 RepID=A0A4Q2JLH0_9MICO|nr:M23 family metallopeptidase [Agromyces fucosus]RXZ49011.1 M23 family metallopeptidase [Agromyces fucosus]
MLESPLVPDDSTPGTQALSRPERPLTRRELRERESAETAAAQRAAAFGQQQTAPAAAQGAPFERQTDASWQAVFTPAAAAEPAPPAPAFTAPAYPTAPVYDAPAFTAPAAPAAPVHTPAPASPAPAFAAAPDVPVPGALRPRRSAAEIPASQAQSEPFAPVAPATHAVPAAPAVPVVIAAPAPTPQAEPVDLPVDRNSAFSVSRAGSDAGAAFDDLFADLGDEPDASASGGRRADASARSARPSRAERKAAKAEKAPKGAKAAKSSRSAAVATTPAVPVAAPEAAPSATADFAAVIAASAMTRIPSSAEAPAPDSQSAEQFVPTAVWQPSNGVAAAQERPRRSAGPDAVGARRSTAREGSSAPRATTGSPKPTAKRRVTRAGRVARMSSGFVAMSFAALLAVATSVPSLSLLSPADVQAMALEQATIGSEPGQQVEITGGTLAQTVQRDGYETQTIDEYARAAGIRPEATFTNNPSGTIQWPFAVGVHIGDRFGYRDCAGCSSDHGGQDFNPGLGAEIQSIADGVVANSTDSGGSLGVVMMIDHIIDGELVTSVYAHMEYNSRRFETGDTVKVGDVIGQTGDTGMSTGPHLHFEIRLGGMSGTKVDPLDWLYANTN